ncbi:hypothetical protein [Arthrobacter sp. SLBN-122]|uniref:hypothetical protein n=1 Tax=Arthrobacter sp. SLBN-122 TaxID=2768455 RepID=UPI00135B1E55|nr:hypothetical protein [Arthrobacter sp. SLBN-122]
MSIPRNSATVSTAAALGAGFLRIVTADGHTRKGRGIQWREAVLVASQDSAPGRHFAGDGGRVEGCR